jgi:hypothetical protein
MISVAQPDLFYVVGNYEFYFKYMKAFRTENTFSTKPSAKPKAFWTGDGTVYSFLVLVLVGSWQFSQFGLCGAAGEFGYRTGVAVAS